MKSNIYKILAFLLVLFLLAIEPINIIAIFSHYNSGDYNMMVIGLIGLLTSVPVMIDCIKYFLKDIK